MHDYLSGLVAESFTVTSSVGLDGVAAGENLAAKFREQSQGVWVWIPAEPLAVPAAGVTLDVSVRDAAGNETRVVRRIGGGREKVAVK
jgi:hypothetical protein